MSGKEGKKESPAVKSYVNDFEGDLPCSPAVKSYVNDFEGDLPCRLVTIVHDEMKQLDTQMANGDAPAAEADDSPVSDAGKTWD